MKTRLLLAPPLLLIALGAVAGALALAGLFPPGGSSQSPPTPVASSIMASPGVSLTLADAEFDDLTVMVKGTVYSTDLHIARIVWDWGDGTVEDSWFPGRHTYSRPGRYTLSVSVHDDRGIQIAAQSGPIDVTN
jgi:PKD repeat protein